MSGGGEVSHDTAVSNAVALIQRLQSASPIMRAPYLAELELEIHPRNVKRDFFAISYYM